MKEEMLESVINELAEEQKQFTQTLKGLQITVADLAEKVAAFDQRLNEQVIAPPADTAAVQKVIDEGLARLEQQIHDSTEKTNQALSTTLEKITAIVEAQPKAVVRQVRFQFFPEHDHNGSFRYFVKWAVLAMTILVVVSALVALGNQWINYNHIERLNNQSAAPRSPQQESLARPAPSFTHPAPPGSHANSSGLHPASSTHHPHPLLTHSADSLPDSLSPSGKPAN